MAKKRPRPSNTPDYPQRADQHIIDTKASSYFAYVIPQEWVAKSFGGKDYGKDFHIEVYGPGGRVGQAFYVQLKGTERCKYISDGKMVSFSMEKKHLSHYMKEVNLPLFIVVVDVERQKGFWLFVQKYLAQNPDWDKADSYSLHIPTTNCLEDKLSFAIAVTAAQDWMKQFRERPIKERIQTTLKKLEAIDPRFKAEITYSDRLEQLRLVATQRVDLLLKWQSKNKKIVAKLKEDLFAKGLPVPFDVGELSVEGSALFDDVICSSGVLQLSANADCQINLTVCDSEGHSVYCWPGIPAKLTGGLKEHCVTSQLGRSPFTVTFQTFENGQKRRANLSVKGLVWLEQSLLSLSYFDKITSFFTHLLKHPKLKLECEIEGNKVHSVEMSTDRFKTADALVEFLRFMEMARTVAHQLKINPTFTEDSLSGDVFNQIEVAHAILTTGRYEIRASDCVLTGHFDRAEAQQFRQLKDNIKDLCTYADETYRFPFMGHQLDLGKVVWELAEARPSIPHSEMIQRLDQAGDMVELSFSPADNTHCIIRRVPEDEWQRYNRKRQ